MNTSQTLRTNIIKCLSDRKMSQIQLAVATQLHESVISRILARKREINVYHLDKILMALQLDFLGYEKGLFKKRTVGNEVYYDYLVPADSLLGLPVIPTLF